MRHCEALWRRPASSAFRRWRVSRWQDEDKSASLRARRGGIGERERGRCARRTERRIPSSTPRDDVPCERIGIDRVLSRVGAAVVPTKTLNNDPALFSTRDANPGLKRVERVFGSMTRRVRTKMVDMSVTYVWVSLSVAQRNPVSREELAIDGSTFAVNPDTRESILRACFACSIWRSIWRAVAQTSALRDGAHAGRGDSPRGSSLAARFCRQGRNRVVRSRRLFLRLLERASQKGPLEKKDRASWRRPMSRCGVLWRRRSP